MSELKHRILRAWKTDLTAGAERYALSFVHMTHEDWRKDYLSFKAGAHNEYQIIEALADLASEVEIFIRSNRSGLPTSLMTLEVSLQQLLMQLERK